MIVAPALTEASTVHELVNELAQKSFTKKAKAVEKIAATGDENAAKLLNALMEGDLFTLESDKKKVVLAYKKMVLMRPSSQSMAI